MSTNLNSMLGSKLNNFCGQQFLGQQRAGRREKHCCHFGKGVIEWE